MEPVSLGLTLATLAAGIGSGVAGWWKNKQQQKEIEQGKNVQLSYNTTPEQRQLVEALGQLGITGADQAYGNMMGDPMQGFSNMQSGMERGFREQALPGLAEGFTGMGMGAQRSGAYPLAREQMAQGFAGQLAGAQGQFEGQRLGQQQGFTGLLSQGAMQRPYENIYKQPGINPLALLLGQSMESLPAFTQPGMWQRQQKPPIQ